MITIILIRLITLVIIAILWQSYGFYELLKFYTSLLFSHYIIAHYSAVKGYRKTGVSKLNLMTISFMFITAFLLNRYDIIDILVFFLFHFVFSEVYLNEFYGRIQDRTVRLLKSGFYSLFYILILNHYPAFSAFDPQIILITMIVSFIIMTIYSKLKNIEYQYHDLIFLITGVVIYQYDFKIYPYLIVMFHLVMWCIIPIVKSPKSSLPMMLTHFFFFILFYIIDLEGYFGHYVYEPKSFLNFFGFLHISLTFVSSNFNPLFIQRWAGFRKAIR